MLENVKKNWYWYLGGLAVLWAVFFAGRFSKKPDIKIQEKVVTKEIVKYVEKEHSETNTNSESQKDKHVHKVTVKVKNKDGSEKETTIIDSDTHKHDTKIEIKYVDRIVYKDKVVTQVKEVTKTVTYNVPGWSLGLKLGTSISSYQADTSFPYFQPLEVGLDLDKRIVGPVWLTAWGMTDTKFKEVKVGLGVKVDFDL